MSEDFHIGPAGLDLPADFLQPFLLRFRREDLHIMAFFVGHSDYEAVEAMIRYRADGTPSIRAILTRHDQRQIDHVNDDHLLAEGGGFLGEARPVGPVAEPQRRGVPVVPASQRPLDPFRQSPRDGAEPADEAVDGSHGRGRSRVGAGDAGVPVASWYSNPCSCGNNQRVKRSRPCAFWW